MRSQKQERWWTELFGGEESEAYLAQHGGRRQHLGRHPALIVVDVVRAFTGEAGVSLRDSVAQWPTSCGPAAWVAMPYIERTVALAAARGWPIVYTTAQPGATTSYGGTVKGEESAMGSPMDRPGAQEIPDEIAPPPGSLILAKPKASAFFATPLLSHLLRHQVDCVVVAGTTTSGCVRASVVDAHSYGFSVFVVEEACFDRARLSHGVNLFEMDAKYADVLTIDELEELASARLDTAR